MTRNRNIAGDAARMARQAASDLANLQRAMRAAQDSATGLDGALKAPETTPRTRTIRGSHSNRSLLLTALGQGFGKLASGGLTSLLNSDDAGDDTSFGSGFSRSSGQIASGFLRGLINGRRIL